MSAHAFLDTGAIYALADQNDHDHVAVREIYADKSRRFLTHEHILVEAFSLITKRLHKHAAIQIISAYRRSPRVEVVVVGPQQLAAGWARCERFHDKEWDWVDCMSFVLMEQRKIAEALSLDHHFTQAGFVLLV